MRKAAFFGLTLAITVGCISSYPTLCQLADAKAAGSDTLVSVNLTVDESAQFVGVEMVNASGRVLQLLLQEWSLSTSTDTSNVVTGDTPNGQVKAVVLAPVTLPPGGRWANSVTMRSHHHYEGPFGGTPGSSFDVSPLISGPTSGAMTPASQCGGSGKITLSYVIQDGAEKKFGSLTVSPHYESVPNPRYKK